MRVRFTWIAVAFLLLGYFIVMPDEGTAATKKDGGLDRPIRASWNLKENVKRMINPGGSGLPEVVVEDGLTEVAFARGGPIGGTGPSLPFTHQMMIVNPDALGTGNGTAASLDVFLPSGIPTRATIHLTDVYRVPDTLTRGVATPPVVHNHPLDPDTTDHQYFEAFSTIQMPGNGAFDHVLIGEVNPDQPGLSISNLQVMQGTSLMGDSFFDVFVEISFDGSSALNPALPVFWLTSAAQVPEPASLGVMAIALAMLRRRR